MSDLSQLMKDLDKAVGVNAEDASVSKYIDTGYPPLNKIMSGHFDGGLPFGRMVEVFGESSTGKTALATEWMINAQRMGGVAIFIDWERSFDEDMAQNMGLNLERPYWLYFKPKTWEEGNVIATKAAQTIRASGHISDDAPILVVFDSIASALPKSQVEKEIDEYTMNDTTALARVTSTTLKAQAQHAENNNATFVYLNQVRLKIGVMFGDPRTTPGGKAMEFYSTARLALGREKIMEAKEGGKDFTGQKIKIECVKSKMTKPFKKCELLLSFSEDGMAHFDSVTSMVEFAAKNGLIEYNKPRVTWTDGKQYFIKALAEKIKTDGLETELRALFKE
jgi:protein RecA